MATNVDPLIHGSAQELAQLNSARRPATAGKPASVLEIETKLEFDGQAHPQPVLGSKPVLRANLISADPPVVHNLDATYFDTEQLDLLRAKVTLRRRTGGTDAGWHLKLPMTAGKRLEQRLPLGDDATTPPAPLTDLIAGTARGRDLVAVCRLENERTVTVLRDKKGVAAVEIADDQVRSTDLRTGQQQAWSEVEVELLQGNTRQLAAVISALQAQGAHAARSASKLARALPLPAPAPAKNRTLGAVVQSALGRQIALLTSVDRDLRAGQPDAPRHLRAVIKRLRAITEVFANLFPAKPLARVQQALADVDHCLGGLRDLQVAAARLAHAAAEEPGDRGSQALAAIDRLLADPLARAEQAVQQNLRSGDYFALLCALDVLSVAGKASGRSAKPASQEILARTFGMLSDLVTRATAGAELAQVAHRVCATARTLRYATEAVATTLGASAVSLAAALEDVQEVLGEYHDAGLTADLLTALAEQAPDGMAGFVFGRWQLTEEALADTALEGFTDAWGRVVDEELAEALSRR